MRIAGKRSGIAASGPSLVAIILALAVAAAPFGTQAQSTMAPTMPAPALTPPPSAPLPPMSGGGAMPVASSPVTPSPVAPSGPSVASSAVEPLPAISPGGAPGADAAKPDMSKSVANLENKATDNAKGVIKHLDSETDAMTLEDLNAARQTVARIDALIDIEKHLAELEKIRGERGNRGGSSSLAAAIPASALIPPMASPVASPTPVAVPSAPVKVEPRIEMPAPAKVVEKPKFVPSNLEVVRVSGAEGKYSAILKTADGTQKPVKVGDEIGNAVVRWITSSTVLVQEEGHTRTLRVKNVDAIFSAMR